MKKINRILIDCSETYSGGLNTGIQRVVRNITERCGRISEKLNIPVIPIVLDAKGYKSLDAFEGDKNNKIKSGLKGGLKVILEEKINIDENQNIYKISRRAWRILKRFKYFLLSLRQICSRFIFGAAANNAGKAGGVIYPEKNDLLLLIDGFWGYRYNYYFYFFCRNIKRKSGNIAVVLYDIIAITNPEFFEKDLVLRFKRALNKFNKLIDAVLTISKSEMELIGKYFNGPLNIKNKQLSFFYLGYDFHNGTCSAENGARKDLLNLTADLKSRIYLMVGTIEPRKGYDYAFEAFESLWESGFNGILVIVGKIGWSVEALMKKFNASVYLNKKFYVFNDLNDCELNFLYKSAAAVICTSLREGYGLPLIEAMHCGAPVLASDIAVFREIGGDYPVYFPPDAKHLAAAVKDFESGKGAAGDKTSGAPDRGRNADNADTWDNSADMFADRLAEIIFKL